MLFPSWIIAAKSEGFCKAAADFSESNSTKISFCEPPLIKTSETPSIDSNFFFKFNSIQFLRVSFSSWAKKAMQTTLFEFKSDEYILGF